MPLYDILCPSGHESEIRAGYEDRSFSCPACGLPAERQAVNAVAFAVAGRTVVPIDQRRVKLSKFMEASHELDHAHKKAEERAQKTLDTPGYYREGVRRAKEVLAGKRAPPQEF